MTDLLLTRHGSGFFPSDGQSIEASRYIKDGESVRCEIKRVRSPDQNRWWHQMLQIVADNQEKYTMAKIKILVKEHLGYCDLVQKPDGTIIVATKSVAFGNMPHDEFNALVNDTVQYVLRELLPNTTGNPRKELESMLFEGAR